MLGYDKFFIFLAVLSMSKSLISFLLLVLLTACSSNEKAGVVYHDRFDFSAVQSYSLYERNSKFTETQGLLDSRRNAIEIAIESSMAINKFNYTDVEKADIIVTYHLFNGKRGEYSKYNETIHFCVPCLRATSWQTENKYQSIMQGNLILDIIDPQKKRSIWRSVYPLALEEKDNSAVTNDKIKQAISLMLAQYPKINAEIKQGN